MRRRLTKVVLATRPPAAGRIEIFDSVCPGFGVRITASGTRTFFVMYRDRGKLVRRTLGSADDVPVADARKAAEAARGSRTRLRRGDLRPSAIPTFADFARAYVAERSAELRPRSAAELRRIVDVELVPAIGGRRLDRITRGELAAVVAAVRRRGPVMANRVASAASVILGRAVRDGIVPDNPAAGLARSRERARDRVLAPDELRAVWDASGTLPYPWRPFIRLLILTGQRRWSVATIRWSDIDLKTRTWTIPATGMKTGMRHDVALSGEAIEELRLVPRRLSTDYVLTTNGRTAISGFAVAKRRLDAVAPVAPWALHDLRRTLMSGLAAAGVAPHVADLILAHRPFKGSAGVYNRYEYADERRRALEAWGERVASRPAAISASS
jgi:integrase